MIEFNYHLFLIKSHISYFLVSNSRTKGIGLIYIYIFDSISLRPYHSIQFYKCEDSDDVHIRKVLLYLIFLGFCTCIETDIWCFNSWCAAFFTTTNQRNWKESWDPVPNTTSDSEARYQWLMKFQPLIYLDPTSRESIQWQPSGSIYDTKKWIGGVD